MINIFGGYYYCKVMNVINVGFSLLVVLFLSDGGYFENFGIFFLLKLKFKKIVVVDGGNIILD